MSMTREEASVLLKIMFAFWANTHERTNVEMEMALNLALTALRPVSREQVEKVWRGYWIHEEIQSNQSTTGYFKISSCECSKCGCYIQQEANFCPYCGAAQTDEAVEMVMERLEELHET